MRLVPESKDRPTYEGDLAGENFQGRSVVVGNEYREVAREWLTLAGASFERGRHKIGSYSVEGIVAGRNGQKYIVLMHGVLDDHRQAGLRRSDTLKKVGFDAIQIGRLRNLPILIMTSHLPRPTATAARILADLATDVCDVFVTEGSLADYQRIRRYLHDDPCPENLPAMWRSRPSSAPQVELFDSSATLFPVSEAMRSGSEKGGSSDATS